jgi:hypothetical protein
MEREQNCCSQDLVGAFHIYRVPEEATGIKKVKLSL